MQHIYGLFFKWLKVFYNQFLRHLKDISLKYCVDKSIWFKLIPKAWCSHLYACHKACCWQVHSTASFLIGCFQFRAKKLIIGFIKSLDLICSMEWLSSTNSPLNLWSIFAVVQSLHDYFAEDPTFEMKICTLLKVWIMSWKVGQHNHTWPPYSGCSSFQFFCFDNFLYTYLVSDFLRLDFQCCL